MDIEPYLTFDGNCEEALEFYAKCLGGKLIAMNRYEGSPMDTPDLPPQWKNKVMHATLEADGKHLMASDRVPSQPFKGYSGISVSVNMPKDATRGKKVFDALSQGGRIEMPFQKTFWGAQFGMLTDRYGVPWMVNCDE